MVILKMNSNQKSNPDIYHNDCPQVQYSVELVNLVKNLPVAHLNGPVICFFLVLQVLKLVLPKKQSMKYESIKIAAKTTYFRLCGSRPMWEYHHY